MIHMRKAKSEFELHIFAFLHVKFSTGLKAEVVVRGYSVSGHCDSMGRKKEDSVNFRPLKLNLI